MSAVLDTPATEKVPATAKAKRAAVFRPDIEGLRALAVTAVLLDHLIEWPVGGFTGVDIFFVISGFLITGLLVREYQRNGRISFGDFYRRRIRRIVPVSTLVILTTVGAAALVFTQTRWADTLADAIWSAFFAANWHFAFIGTDYLLGSGQISPLRHYWSLAVEEQFYLVWPWVIIGGFLLAGKLGIAGKLRARTGLLAAGAGVVVAVSFVWAMYETSTTPTMAYFSTLSRGWELGIGALLAIVAPLIPAMGRGLRTALAWVGMIGIFAGLFLITPQSPFPAPWAIVPVVSTALVILAGTGPVQPVNPVLTNPVAQYLGRISYSLYLWHFPVIIILAAVLPPELPYFILCAALILLLSVFSFHFVEDPIRHSNWLERTRVDRWGSRKPALHAFRIGPTVAGWAAAVALVTVFLVVLAMLPKSAPGASIVPVSDDSVAAAATPADARTQRVQAGLGLASWPSTNPPMDSLNEQSAVDEWIVDGCLRVDQNSRESCVYGDPSAPKKAVLLGDSTAISYMPAIRGALEPLGFSVRSLTMFSCPAMDVSVTGNTSEICDRHHSWVYDEVKAYKPDLVIMTSLAGTIIKLRTGAEGQDALAEWNAATQATVNEIKGSVGQVVVMAPPPARDSILDCKTAISTPKDCVVSPSKTYDAFVQSEKAAIETIGGNTHYVESTPWFCFRGTCPPIIDNVPVTYDGTHLVRQASAQLTDVMSQEFQSVLSESTATTEEASG